MSTQLKPYLKEIADKIRDNRENLYPQFLLYNESEMNLMTDEWTVWPYNFGITNVSKTSAGVRIETDGTYDSRCYYGVFIKIGTCEDCNGKTFIASIDPVENVTIKFGSTDDGWDAISFGEEGSETITHKYLWGVGSHAYHNWFGLWIMCNSAGTYEINNIVIKDVSPINAKDYPTEIDNVGEAKYNEGHADGRNSFWDDYICNGIEKSWTGGRYAFSGEAWNDITFNPTRNIYTSAQGFLNCQRMFAASGITDLKGILERNGVKLSTKNAKNFDQFAYVAGNITRFPELDMSVASRLSECFTSCTNLKSIDKIILSSTTAQAFTSTFSGCSALEEIRFDGLIRSNISFAQSLLLSYESLKSIIGCLYDFVANGSTTTCTLTLHADAKVRLTDSDIARINEKGWTVA